MVQSVRKDIPTGSLVLLAKPNSAGESCVYLRYYLGKYVKRSTNVNVPVADWDDKHQRLNASCKDSARINNILYTIKAEIDAKLINYDGPITYDILKKIVNDEPVKAEERAKATDFYEYCKQINDLHYGKKEYSYSTWYNKTKYINAFEYFVKYFLHKPTLLFSDLKPEIFDKYIAYRFEVKKNISKEGVNKTLVPLYDAIKYAVNQGIVEMRDVHGIIQNYVEVRETEYNPEDDEMETKIPYLTLDQLQQLHDIQPRLKHQRSREILDFFFFAFYACGMRISDLMTLEWNHIDWENKVIKKKQFKTKRYPEVLTPLSPAALEILERWKGYGRNKRFVFDMIPENYDITNQAQLHKDRNAKDRTFNVSLHTVSMTLRFKQMATMHSARHSFAVMAINNGISLYLLSKLMGHSSITATEKTYAKFLKEKVDSDIKTIIGVQF